MANVAWNLHPIWAVSKPRVLRPDQFRVAFGTLIATVEVDIETGKVKVLRYVAVDDCGPRSTGDRRRPVHGGIVQGIGEALQEVCVYDADGQLLTGTMMDYAVPRASQLPHMEVDHTVTPSPVNPLGVKGIGETGTIASGITIVNAVCDALAPLGITHLDKPLTAARVWDAVRQARGGAR
jgi:carbon-monoxide dehydrogenase large subunit